MKNIIMGVLVMATIITTNVTEAAPVNVEAQAIALIAKYEQFRATPYVCPGGVKTIGYGFSDPSVVAKGTLTRAEADRILGQRVRQEIAWVKKTFPKLTAKQQVGIVSLAYNLGHDKLCWKTVNGKRVHTDAYNALIGGKWAAAATEIKEFRMAGGEVLAGLVKRRAAEVKFLVG